jgi:TRAP-type C4-dicarboxylate transport system permease small subunit
MAAVFAVGCGIAMIWSAVKYQIVYRSVIDSFPPQFQELPTSRYAFPVLALSHSTPLPLQAEYVKSLWSACVGFLCLSLCFFSLPQPIIGCVCLVVFLASTFSTIKSWKTYKENCDRAMTRNDKEEP